MAHLLLPGPGTQAPGAAAKDNDVLMIVLLLNILSCLCVASLDVTVGESVILVYHSTASRLMRKVAGMVETHKVCHPL